MPPDLTDRQQHLFSYLKRSVSHMGRIPSLRQAAAELGVSHAAVAQGLRYLEEKGYIKRDGRYSRAVYLLNPANQADAPHRWREVPIVGRVAAGLPLYAQQEWDGTVVLDGSVFKGRNLFALRVQGDSMQGAGILDADLAICEPRQYARDGEIVVALVRHEEATVKRFFRLAEHIELKPENPRYPIMRYSFDEVLVQGKVIGIQRGPNGIG